MLPKLSKRVDPSPTTSARLSTLSLLRSSASNAAGVPCHSRSSTRPLLFMSRLSKLSSRSSSHVALLTNSAALSTPLRSRSARRKDLLRRHHSLGTTRPSLLRSMRPERLLGPGGRPVGVEVALVVRPAAGAQRTSLFDSTPSRFQSWVLNDCWLPVHSLRSIWSLRVAVHIAEAEAAAAAALTRRRRSSARPARHHVLAELLLVLGRVGHQRALTSMRCRCATARPRGIQPAGIRLPAQQVGDRALVTAFRRLPRWRRAETAAGVPADMAMFSTNSRTVV